MLAVSIHIERFCGIIVASVVGIVFHFGIVKISISAEWIVARTAVHAIIAILILCRLF